MAVAARRGTLTFPTSRSLKALGTTGQGAAAAQRGGRDGPEWIPNVGQRLLDTKSDEDDTGHHRAQPERLPRITWPTQAAAEPTTGISDARPPVRSAVDLVGEATVEIGLCPHRG
jgi:hypothetical protein